MGSSSYSDVVYTSRVDTAARSGTDLFAHTAAITAGRAENKVHADLDPGRKNKAGKIVRESFDSDAHPNSRPVAVFFDVTGSMRDTPRKFATKLNTLMAALVKDGFLADPHILFGAVGDATCDAVPLQIGQFEAGNEMDAALTNIVLEGGGGGQTTESYELALYFAARHTDLACNARGEKGYLFIIGDERPYSRVKAREVQDLIGVDIGEDIPLERILAEAREKFHVFWILPGETSHFGDHTVVDPLRNLFGQSLIHMPNPDEIVETIVTAIGSNEGHDLDDIGDALRSRGSSADAVNRATTALATYSAGTAVAKTAVVSGGNLAVAPKSASRTGLVGPRLAVKL